MARKWWTLTAVVAGALAQTLAAHMKHEEDQAPPLVEAHLGPDGWAAFRKATGKIQGLRGGAEFFPWMLDGASADASKKVLGMLPPPARLLYRAVWRPRYARTLRWDTTAARTTTDVCADMRRAEDEIHASNLDWTIMRPPSLTDKAARGTYRTATDRNLSHGFSISRADLAACMLTLPDNSASVHRHVAIAN
jgi:hypothetical protein